MEMNLVQTTILKKIKKDACLASYTVKTKSNGKKKVAVLSTSHLIHGKMKMNDYYTKREKSCRWVIVALFYMLGTSRVNWKTIWCLKYKEDISKLSWYNFGWDLAKALVLPHVRRWKLHGLTSMVQLKIKMFQGIALKVSESVPNFQNKYKCTDKRKRCKIREDNCWSKGEKDNIPMPKEQC